MNTGNFGLESQDAAKIVQIKMESKYIKMKQLQNMISGSDKVWFVMTTALLL